MKSIALVLSAAVASAAAGQEAEPVTGIPGLPTRSAVVDLSEAPDATPSPQARQPGEAVHVPLPRPQHLAGPVPGTPRRGGAPESERSVIPLGPSPPITEDFLALPDDNTKIPPDTHGAVGPNHLMVTLNTQVRIQNRDGSLATADRSLNTFWSAVDPGGGAFDPRSVYDPYADRWISVACDDARFTTSALLIGSSRTGNPTGLWDLHSVDADGADTLWADFPSVGLNNKWVVVQVNMFTISMPFTFVRSHIYVFDRAALYAGGAPFVLIQDASGFTQAPAVTYDMTQDDLFLLELWSGPAGQLRLSKLSGLVNLPALSEVGFPTGPPWASLPVAADHAPQSGSIQRIATNDARIQNLVYRNGTLWATHTVFASTPGPVGRASVQWWQLSTAGGVLQNGRIDDASGVNFYAFPSIAVNKLGDALLGFSCFAASRFASACYALRKATDAPGTFQDVATLKPGLDSYHKIFSGSVNRWGDYSATVVDPVNDVDLWTIQEYAELFSGGFDRWGTWWGHLALPPDITIDDVSLVEGNSGTTNARFTISLSFASTQTVEVNWIATDATATLADGDFLPASSTATFPPGTTTQFVDVPVAGDFKLEPHETFTVELSSPVFGVIADAQGQGTILNDDPVPRMSIDDVRVLEGDTIPPSAIFTVTLSNPSASPAQASWSTANGTAVAPGDYTSSSGTISFAPGDTSETLSLFVTPDLFPEPTKTFHVNLTSPVGAVLGEARGIGTILDDDGLPANPDVGAFTIVSDGAGGPLTGRNKLQWVNPIGGSPIEMRIRYNEGNGCLPPNPGSPGVVTDGVISLGPAGAPGEPRFFDHTGLDNTSYCYTFWVIHTGDVASPGVSAIGRPFNATGKLKWKYSTSTTVTGVAPPTVGIEGILAVDNAGDVHAMRRTATGGPWPTAPAAWNPLNLGSASQGRNPIIPRLAGSRAFISTQNGRVHSVDSVSGALHWSTLLSPPSLAGTRAPAGIFTAFGGEHDAVFAGTSALDDNVFHALDPVTGTVTASFGPPLNSGIGAILGMAVVDYSSSPNRVYFVSRQGTGPAGTLWCLDLGPPGPVTFTLNWRIDVGEIDGSPVLRNGRIYVGNNAGEVKSVDAVIGPLGVTRTAALGDGPIKDFVFPDRGSSDLYVSTNAQVWRLSDPGSGTLLTVHWGTGGSVPSPSVPVLRPGATHLYVGGSDGKLYEITLPGGSVVKSLALDYDPGGFAVGTPTYDGEWNLVHVGSVRGTFYAVQAPLP